MKLSLLTLLGTAAAVHATTTSINYGSLGAVANGTNMDPVALNQTSPLAAPGDVSNGYSGGGALTQVPFLSALNPSASSPFTIEFWAYPTNSDGDDAWVVNREANSPRSGWTFFQRGAGVGWNLRMYNGIGSQQGWDLTGGTSILFAWSHVVATWDGSAAQLYVNGALADNVNDTGNSPVYNPNGATSPTLNLGANFDGGSPINGLLDEVAWYPSALSASQIANHYSIATTSLVPGAYGNAVIADGAALYLPNVPEPSTAALAGLLGLTALRRRRS